MKAKRYLKQYPDEDISASLLAKYESKNNIFKSRTGDKTVYKFKGYTIQVPFVLEEDEKDEIGNYIYTTTQENELLNGTYEMTVREVEEIGKEIEEAFNAKENLGLFDKFKGYFKKLEIDEEIESKLDQINNKLNQHVENVIETAEIERKEDVAESNGINYLDFEKNDEPEPKSELKPEPGIELEV